MVAELKMRATLGEKDRFGSFRKVGRPWARNGGPPCIYLCQSFK